MTNLYYRIILAAIASFAVAVTPAFSQVRYVKADANGANDGTSWMDAYVSLDSALADAEAGQIWVAAGTYKPGGATADSTSRFAINRSLVLLGGFAGTEATADERDPAANITILNGDINGNDVINDFDNNKEDNVLHVVYVDSLIGDPVVIDGFTISGGHNNVTLSGISEYFYRGAGIFAYSPVEVYHCTFTQNFAASGAGVYARGYGGDFFGSTFENCIFTENLASDQAALFIAGLLGVTVENCEFTNNTVNRGALYPNTCNGVTISNCLFSNNSNPTGTAAGLFSWQNINVTITGCEFLNNSAVGSGAGYIDGRDVTTFDPETYVIENCNFENNAGTNGACGGLRLFSTSYRMSNCNFLNNSSTSSGGQLFNSGENRAYIVENCAFEGGAGSFGGAMTNYSSQTNATIRDCSFTANTAASGGGAMINGFGAIVNVENCQFENNEGGSAGGAIFNQNAGTDVSISGCDFISNSSPGFGGALLSGFQSALTIEDCLFQENEGNNGGAAFIQNDTTTTFISDTEFISNSAMSNGGAIAKVSGAVITIDHCTFQGNAAENSGGALNSFDFSDTEDLGGISITNSIFDFNFAQIQGGAINLSNTPTQLTNSVILNNSALEGAGGGLLNNINDSVDVRVGLLNVTFANNVSTIGANFSQWSEGGEWEASTEVQNTIFYSELGDNYMVEAGVPVLTSLGGNLSNDASMDTILTATQDVTGLDPLFVDANNSDLHLMGNSPAIDGGIAEGAPEFDIEGTPRMDNPDIGAYEFMADNTREVIALNLGQLRVYPNPAGASTLLTVNNDWRGDLRLRVTTVNGQEIINQEIQKNADRLELPLDVSRLTPGVYRILVSDGQEMLTMPLVKQ